MSGIPSKLIHIEQSVKEALANGEPVVALESTIIGTILSTSFSMQVNNNVNTYVASLNLFFFASFFIVFLQLMVCRTLKIWIWHKN
jgi:pseudouridine-5'-phosphate glycosidase